jgi:hypothetical protein
MLLQKKTLSEALVHMDTAPVPSFSQFHFRKQGELIPFVEDDLGIELTPPLERLVIIWDLVEIERLVPYHHDVVGRPQIDRVPLARAFIAKAVLGIKSTAALIDRLKTDRTLYRLCGFDPMRPSKKLNEALFSRAFAEFTKTRLAERAHEALIKASYDDKIVGHLSMDSTAIEARETVPKSNKPKPEPRKPGRPRKDEIREPAKPKRIEKQFEGMPLAVMIDELPKAASWGGKKNSAGNHEWWKGYKLHLNVADNMVVVSAILTSASVHDSQVAIPLTEQSAQRVTSLYDLRDAAYCSPIIEAHSESHGHVPLIDHNPRTSGAKKEFLPHEAERYKERTNVERANSNIKDNFGGRNIYVRGHAKLFSHLMFGVLAMTAEQLMRWVI